MSASQCGHERVGHDDGPPESCDCPTCALDAARAERDEALNLLTQACGKNTDPNWTGSAVEVMEHCMARDGEAAALRARVAELQHGNEMNAECIALIRKNAKEPFGVEVTFADDIPAATLQKVRRDAALSAQASDGTEAQ